MTNFYDACLNYLKASKIALYERFAPYYIASTCCHIVNLENQKREFFLENVRVANTRMHVFMVAPPGFCKTLFLQKFLMGHTSVLGNTTIDVGFEGSMTEAGFTGTVRISDGEPVIVKGAAFDHREAILGIDEFSALANAMKMEHSINLDSAMLTALDSGYLIKRLALGKIQYITSLTLWSGSQPARFDLTSGLGRRFLFIYFIPTQAEADDIKQARREGKNILPDLGMLHTIKKSVKQIQEDVQELQKIKFDNSIYKTLDRLKIPHFEEALYERLALGYTVAVQNGCDKTLEVTMTPQLQLLFKQAHDWRLEIKKGAETGQVMQVLKEMNMCLLSDVKRRLTDFGLEYGKSGMLIDLLRKQGRIAIVTDEKKGKRGRPRRIVMVLED